MVRSRNRIEIEIVTTLYTAVAMFILILCIYFHAKGFFEADVLFIAAVAFSVPICVIQFLRREGNTLAVILVTDILMLVILVFEDFVL